MIVKVLARHNPSYGSLIEYLAREEKGKNGKPIILTHNFKGSTKDEWVKEFIENEAFRQHVRKDQIYLYHEIVSLSSNENKNLISQEILQDLANQYISLRGKEGMYIISFHDGKDNAHIHFAVSGVKYRTGEAHRLTHSSLKELKMNFQDYHKGQYPFLSFSNPEHGKGTRYIKDAEHYSRTKRTNVKEFVKEKIHELFNESKDQQHFLELLQENNLNHYERNGKPTGVIFEDLKFRFTRLDIPFDEKSTNQEITTRDMQTLDDIRSLREKAAEKHDEVEKDL